ncbi:MAG: D-alanyl-D-alanine carboxypeptidase/D-alanyl-D-alanine-endopeptidase, partial [Ktedonobacteraceae bacterium]|nr:D-alanyl-D-alanine carboxypeptidase/D-alanyl-D-alanine-endopeptidase [Ktedonobacteraceae bacterium]
MTRKQLQNQEPRLSRRSILRQVGTTPLILSGMISLGGLAVPRSAYASIGSRSDQAADLATTIQAIIDRPQFQGSHWGMNFRRFGAAQPLYALNSDQLFVAASTAKIFTAGTAFSTLGSEYRFHTRVYRTGPVRDGVLEGDLVLMASGDLLISNRIRPDGTLDLPIPDHSYNLPNTMPVLGDPLALIRNLARKAAAHGIRSIRGRVLVDASLFHQAQEAIGVPGIGPVTISPMMINDNIIDVLVTPGSSAGAPGVLQVSPQTGYLQIENQVTTVHADASPVRPLGFVNDVTNPDGTHAVTLVGDIPLSIPHLYCAYYIPDPVRFAELAFAEALKVECGDTSPDLSTGANPMAAAPHGTARGLLAEHVSPPLREAVKVMLKTSSNLHTVMWIYDLGAIAGHNSTDPKTTYAGLLSELFASAGLSSSPGSTTGEYSPDFFVEFLSHMVRQPYFPSYHDALSIMGKDGSLVGVQVQSPAAGHVFAKTGTGLGSSATGPLLEAGLV